MKIAIGSDHGGWRLKEKLKRMLENTGDYDVIDVGTFSKEPVDYPDIAALACAEVTSGRAQYAILLCGTGIGISIAANKIAGIRAALCNDAYSARMSREHNDANVLTMGGRVIGWGLAVDIVNTWLKATFQGGRHEARVAKITALEKND